LAGSRETWQGLLWLKEEDCAEAHALWECDADQLVAFLQQASRELEIPVRNLSPEDLKYYLNAESFHSKRSFVLVNTQQSGDVTVGRFAVAEKKMNLTKAIIYPGNVAALPGIIQGLLEISFNSGLENPSIPPTTIAQEFYNGQSLGIIQVNQRRDLLPKHTLVSNAMSFGAAQWNTSWVTPRILINKEKLGFAYMPGYASAVTLNTLLIFDTLNLSRPAISSSNSLIALGNSTAFPWFVRNGISDLYFAALYSNILPEIGWKRCAVLYGDDVWGISVYATFKELADFRHIEILNNETLRQIPSLA
jgi:hypothetical protein